MIAGANLVPVAMLMAGVTVTATVGQRMAKRVINTAKVGLTEYELSGIASQLKQDYIYGTNLDDFAGDPSAFSEHVVENMQADRGRDPSLDLWGIPFNFVKDSQEEAGYIVYSLGPNMSDDVCGEEIWDPNAWEERLSDFDVSEEAIRAEVEAEEAGISTEYTGPDDVCLRFKVSTTDRSPYKRIGR